MIHVIRADERYHFQNDWLSTYWHFSFDQYYDPANVSFGPLRVFNDDTIRPGGGFPTHGHREMEIVTYVLEGQLEHRDDMGNVGVIGPDEVQRMSAGTGVRHSEYNASKEKPVHLIQLWVLPAVKGLQPSWEQKSFDREKRVGRLLPVVVPVARAAVQARDEAVRIHQETTIYSALLRPGDALTHPLEEARQAYLFVAAGELRLSGSGASGRENEWTLRAGDQARITDERSLLLTGPGSRGPDTSSADVLLLDLP